MAQIRAARAYVGRVATALAGAVAAAEILLVVGLGASWAFGMRGEVPGLLRVVADTERPTVDVSWTVLAVIVAVVATGIAAWPSRADRATPNVAGRG